MAARWHTDCRFSHRNVILIHQVGLATVLCSSRKHNFVSKTKWWSRSTLLLTYLRWPETKTVRQKSCAKTNAPTKFHFFCWSLKRKSEEKMLWKTDNTPSKFRFFYLSSDAGTGLWILWLSHLDVIIMQLLIVWSNSDQPTQCQHALSLVSHWYKVKLSHISFC